MTQYPSHDPSASYGPAIQAVAKTSVLAILSLICALLCITSPLGLVFGGLAIVLISRSNGRTKGMGLAIAGTVIGLIFSTFLIMGVVGAMQVGKMFSTMVAGPVVTAVQNIEKGDYAAARTGFSPTLDAATSDAEMKAFHDELTQNFGAFKAAPSSLFDIIGSYSAVGPQFQAVQAQLNQTPGAMPIPLEFDNGVVLMVVEYPSNAMPQAGATTSPFDRLGVYLPTSNTIVWMDEAGDQTGAAGGSTTPSTPDDTRTPGAPAPDEPVPAPDEPAPAAQDDPNP